MTTPERDDEPAAGQDFARVWRVLAHIVTPSTVVAALMIYVGAVRVNTLYRTLGVHPTMLDLSYQEYALHSASSLTEPVALILLVILVVLPAHALLARFVAGHRTATMRAIAVLTVLGAAGALAGLLGAAGWLRPPTHAPVVPMGLGLSVFALGYAASLYAKVKPRPGHSPTGWVVQRTVFVALLMVLLLWSLTVLTQTRAQEAVDNLRHQSWTLPGAVVYTPQRLHLAGAGITETPLPGQNAMYRYRYSGLSLLIHSNGKYFLLPACWPMTWPIQAIALPADGSLRLEFFSHTVPPACPPGD
ncbi:hypothetical protein [Nonomuraea sp. NPDC049480]|uniref:hypothetical protein n=1 Tax=Nonomuraea sp. NPDC049480 TaxID=3364353 RepID=UPI0037A98E25